MSEEHRQAIIELAKQAIDHEKELDKFLKENTVKIDPQQRKEWHKAAETMEFLDIPCNTGGINFNMPPSVYATDLYDILMDQEKLRVLVAKLRNKAFW